MSALTSFIKRHSLAIYLGLVFLFGWIIQFFARMAQEHGDQSSWTALLAADAFSSV